MKQPLYLYLQNDEAYKAKLIAEKILGPDYIAYLYDIHHSLFVLVDVDYFGGLPVAEDIAKAFSVRLLGWVPLKKEARSTNELVPVEELNTLDGGNDMSDQEWATMHRVADMDSGYKHLLAKVEKIQEK
ncbi:MAG TPA: hypothetical protein VLA88_02775 [Candidatus Saccharimonadales bacterium]|nr:hypothetical protein [Candidatus Saccharimonadales bacterium]